MQINVPGPDRGAAVDEDGVAAAEDGVGELSMKLAGPDAETFETELGRFAEEAAGANFDREELRLVCSIAGFNQILAILLLLAITRFFDVRLVGTRELHDDALLRCVGDEDNVRSQRRDSW